jgi:ATP-dependent Clp protease ATP-binding subunit ClpC
MRYFIWHYTKGIKIYLQIWFYYLRKLNHFFSFSVLVKTLFAPWKKLTSDDYSGLNLQRLFEDFMFNLISVGIGFSVRASLIFFGLAAYLLVLILGFLGLLLWYIFPFISLKLFFDYQNQDSITFHQLLSQIRSDPTHAARLALASPAGRFIQNHLSSPPLIEIISALDTGADNLSSLKPSNYQDLFQWLISLDPKTTDQILRLGFKPEDIIRTARWWDLFSASSRRSLLDFKDYGRSGIGIELLYGYSPTLNRYSVNLNQKKSFSQNLVGRHNLVDRIQAVLNSGRSAILVGQPGVGKMTIIYEFAHKASTGQLGPIFASKRIVLLDLEQVLSQGDFDDKTALFRKLITEADRAGNFILVIKNLHRVINRDVAGYDFTDTLVSILENHHLQLISVISPVEYERFISRDSRLLKYFDLVEAVPPSKEEAFDILAVAASEREAKSSLLFSIFALNAILDGSDRYITETPFPEKTLDLLSEVASAQSSDSPKTISADDVNQVLSQKTKIPLARLTESEKSQLSNLEDIIHQNLIGQNTAVSLIAKSLRSRSVGLKDDHRPVGTFLFLGPTGVGKTQTAKVLSRVYFGHESKILRFDMAEYIGPEGISRLIGSAANNQPGLLTSAIKNQPAALLLLDEIEKSPPEIFNLFLTLLDEGYITDAFGQKINCNHLFVIATSNAGAEFIRQSVTSGQTGDQLQRSVVEHIQKNAYFSPEFLNRFDGVVVFEPLAPDQLNQITGLLLNDLKINLETKNIFLEFDPQTITKLVIENYDPAMGARPIRRAIDLVLSDTISRAILGGEVVVGDKIKIAPGSQHDQYLWSKLP